MISEGTDVKTGQVVATLEYDFVVIGFGNNGARQFDYVVYLENIKTSGTGVNWNAAVLTTSFTGCGIGMDCPVTTRAATIPEWRAVNTFAATFTSPDTAGAGDQIVRSTTGLNVVFETPTQPEWRWSPPDTFAKSLVRFDSASYVGRARGAVFTGYRLVFTVDLRQANQKESALHIKHAMERPELTFPSWVGKTVPGKTEPLTRMYNPADNNRNRTKSEGVCRDVYGSWDSNLDNCDEFPFASTYEGSYTGPRDHKWGDRFSVRLIDKADNQYVGSQLLEIDFYRALRVLDHEEFFVSVLG